MTLVVGQDYAADQLVETIARGEDWVRELDKYTDGGTGGPCSTPVRGPVFVADAAATLTANAIVVGVDLQLPVQLFFVTRGDVGTPTPARVYVSIARTAIETVFREGAVRRFDWEIFYNLNGLQEVFFAGQVTVADGAYRP